MSQKILGTLMGIGLAVALVGCGGGEKKAGEQAAKVDSNPSATAETPAPEMTPVTPDTTRSPSAPRYKTVHDANATYGSKDLPNEGSYLKLDFTELTPAQLNRVIHRVRTEMCTCGCTGDTIDQCLVNDPSCVTAVTLANQVIREEKLKS